MSARPRNRAPAAPGPDFAKLLRRWKTAASMYQIVNEAEEPEECERLYLLRDARLDELLSAPIASPADAALKLRAMLDLIHRDLLGDVRYWTRRIASELETLDRGRP